MKKNCNTYQSIADLIDRLVHVGRLLGASDDGALETCDNFGLVRFLDLSKERKKTTYVEKPRKYIYIKEIANHWQRHSRIPTSQIRNESAKDCMLHFNIFLQVIRVAARQM